MNNDAFGPHLTLDLIGCPREILSNYNLHFDLLKELPEMIGMTPITQPYVFPFSGFVLKLYIFQVEATIGFV